MEESHHRNIMDHLELGPSSHHLQEDLSKGVLRTIHNVENGTLHFITIPPATNSREQEYIESSLLGADLLSSHLPNGLLVDYIGAPGSANPTNQFHPQTNLLDHHGGIQTYTAEDLQSLVDASSLQSPENDRKLFLQFVNKPAPQLSHEAPVIVTNPKDVSSVNNLSEHDKLGQSSHSQLGVNHMPVVTTGNSFLHYHQDQLLSTTHNSVNNMANAGNVLATHHNAHHHHSHHHAQTISHQIIQNTTQQQQQQQQQPQLQHQNQSHLSSIHSMLQGECSPSKLFHVASSSSSANIAISTATSQNCIQIPPLTPIKRVESPKRYLTYQMVQTQTPVERTPTNIVPANNFLTREDLIDCEPRSEDEEDHEAVNTLNSNHFTNTYLPHKKRLSKKLGDSINGNQIDQFHRDSVISNDHQLEQEKRSQHDQRSEIIVKTNTKAFACQLCSDSFEDQLMFFTHLKGHYEPTSGSPNEDGKSNDPKRKPKLPRVKHTKKLKNDKSTSQEFSEDVPTGNNIQEIQQNTYSAQNSAPDQIKEYQQEDRKAVMNDSQTVPRVFTEPDNAEEFSETEDMLEGIRNVVQKVQEAVDTDTNDGLCDSRGRSMVNDEEKAWLQAQQHIPPNHHTTTDMVRNLDFGGELDTQEIHINAGNDNFVLFLNKSDFHEQEMLDQSNQHQQQQQSTNLQQQSVERQISANQSSQSILQQLQPNHNPSSAAYILNTEQQSTINECDMNIQILGLSSTELVDFNLTTPQMNELSDARLLKDHHPSTVECNGNVEDNSDDRFYFSDEEEEEEEEEFDDSRAEANSESEQEQTGIPTQNCSNNENIDQTNSKEVIMFSAPPGKKKGRKKAGGVVATKKNGEVSLKKADKKYPCAEPDCDKVFNSKTAVRYHELQHKNERPYKCLQCPKNFFTSSALKVHERLHSGEKPYKCEECGRAFRQWGDMKYHQSSIHSNEKTHQCEFCGKKFARRYSLVLHRKIHLNEKNHVCDICNKAFRASSYLQSHRMIHTGEKPYACSICFKKFRCGGDMKRHLKTHDRNKTITGTRQTEQMSKDLFDKTAAKVMTRTDQAAATDVIDLTKIKSENGNKASAIQVPPVVTVLSKDINHTNVGSKIATSAGHLIYLTSSARDQFRKPEETVLADVTRW
ncbi:uncharacterized protein LOC129778726 [Toxorhynchites rutilus septentrionalis]|uniref:uncharacterized protein LOC129778726 n=1 Tax=Toxorhynchites rutilus septentrionalis TaxID=329112 RepID=UPI00247917CA|nr:uncharacterized protein LOC129778726 [Toxorhynchites rutilus septentrionalis]